MRIDIYSSSLSYKRPFSWSKFLSSHVEPMLLSLLILTGILGSFYVFGLNFLKSDGSLSQTQPQAYHNSIQAGTNLSSNKFDDYVKFSSPIEAGKPFEITFLEDNMANRYVLEMGDGMRMSVTNKSLTYTYGLKGKYVVELKVLKDGLFHLIGTKKVKVK
ncbi:MAG: hypothetical protein R2774_05835 [Saprospiraceae bacterium]